MHYFFEQCKRRKKARDSDRLIQRRCYNHPELFSSMDLDSLYERIIDTNQPLAHRVDAVNELTIAERAAIPVLQKLLENEYLEIRKAAASGLAVLFNKDEKAIELLLTNVVRERKSGSKEAIDAMSSIDSDVFLPVLLETLKHGHYELIERAAVALFKMGKYRELVGILAADSSNLETRFAIAFTSGSIRGGSEAKNAASILGHELMKEQYARALSTKQEYIARAIMQLGGADLLQDRSERENFEKYRDQIVILDESRGKFRGL